MEKSFEEFIDKMKIPKEIFAIRKSSLLKWGSSEIKKKSERVPYLQGQLLSIENKMNQIETKIISINSE